MVGRIPVVTEVFVVLGSGTPKVPALLWAPSTLWNWSIAQSQGLTAQIQGALKSPQRWCRIVQADEEHLRADPSVLAFERVPIPPLALAAWDTEFQRAAQWSLDFDQGD
jgi:hypothetical protein